MVADYYRQPPNISDSILAIGVYFVGLTQAWNERPDTGLALGGSGLPKSLHQLAELIRLANKAVDLRRTQGRRQHLLAIGAG